VSQLPLMLKRALHAFVAFCFGQGIATVGYLFLVPLYLHVWPASLYGEWLALGSVVAYFSCLHLGVQTWAVNRLTHAYARGEMEEYRRVRDTAFGFYFCLALAGSTVLAVFAFFAPVGSWFHLSITSRYGIFFVLLLLGGQFLWTMPASLLWWVYGTTGDLARTQWVMNVSKMLTLALTGGALLLWPRLVVVAAAQAAGFLAIVGLVWWDVHRRFPELAPGFKRAKASLVRPILGESIFFAIINWAVALTLHGANLVMAGMLGTAALALFVTTRTLANSIRQLVGLIVHSSSTNLTRLEALEDKERLRLAFRLVLFVTVAGCVAVSASLWFEGASVFTAWTRGRLAVDLWLLRLFLLWLVLQSPWMAASAIPVYTNKHKGLAMSYIVSSIGGLLLGALLMPRLGLKALPVAFMVAEALACYHFVVRNACRIIGEPYLPFAAKLWSGTIGVGACAFAATWVIHIAPNLGTFPRWICSGAASLAAVGLSGWLVWFREDERGFVIRKANLGVKQVGRFLPLSLRPTDS
jgi:O-antigen/teichoic acid export membrane protein